jgi:hypothetical protein
MKRFHGARAAGRPAARGAAVVALALALGSCDEPHVPPELPVPGTLVVSLATPHAGDAALALRLTGPAGVEEVAFAEGYLGFARSGAQATRVAVFGAVGTGAVLRFEVPDVRRVGEYKVVIEEVADGGNRLRDSLEGYAATVTVE